MVKLVLFDGPIRTRAIVGKPPYYIVIVNAGVSYTNMTIILNRNRPFLNAYMDLIHEFTHIILFYLGFKQDSFFQKMADFISCPKAFFEKWDSVKLFYNKA